MLPCWIFSTFSLIFICDLFIFHTVSRQSKNLSFLKKSIRQKHKIEKMSQYLLSITKYLLTFFFFFRKLGGKDLSYW